MKNTEKLYETLGELLYAIAKADGLIQDEERDALNELLKNHSWASEIRWSFNYEENQNATVEETYNKVINYCHSYGPTAEYEEFIDAMKFIANASNGIDEDESKIINSFSKDLIERFQRDLNLQTI
ncbi:TerB family tellurite resistance protein [Flammeovirga kamogawensis]|uniref:TerB family tellurite resistance protein n=1 Tax=Flammeovirga kamogawensis TaxID=373891 RepID=A0ABX8H041_9BACT|nr:TerB family tellurite resistance protein [Flammeovirga kamogawensis]MBB6459296.1 putative tellurite resistance protein B-like protein [Flammeovirga kamogawensis]QWG08856.1 TerB family tellurite resistance protein [Flammeovirga kamogawensis]TRX67146.1 TerB family tellurite resistance protein [Flammeovirga kamogawensis]